MNFTHHLGRRLAVATVVTIGGFANAATASASTTSSVVESSSVTPAAPPVMTASACETLREVAGAAWEAGYAEASGSYQRRQYHEVASALSALYRKYCASGR